MIRLRLDYQRSTTPFPLAGGVLLLSAIAVTALAGVYYHHLAVDLAEWEAILNRSGQASGRPMTASDLEARREFQDIRQANDVLRQLTLPWENLFSAVELSTDRNITLLGMEPDTEKHIVNISCEAKDVAAMLKFIQRLEQQREFSSVYLQNHQIQEHDPDRPVRFSLTAFWRAAT